MMTAKNMRDALETLGFGLFKVGAIWTAYRFNDETVSVSDDDLESVYHGVIKLGRA
jgi:hypothetical protein